LLALSGPRNPYPEGKFGLIEAGAHADILLIDGNPLEEMSVMTEYEEKFDLIMKGGTVYKDQIECTKIQVRSLLCSARPE